MWRSGKSPLEKLGLSGPGKSYILDAMSKLTVSAMLVVLASHTAAETPPAKATEFAVRGYGQVRIVPIRRVGKVPRVDLQLVKDGILLLSVVPSETKELDVIPENTELTVPLYGFFDLQTISKQALLVVTKQYHATDCEYVPAIAAFMSDNNFKTLTHELPAFFTRGGVGFDFDSAGTPVLIIWSERYQMNDVHYTGPSKFEVYRYRFDSQTNKFVLRNSSLVAAEDLIVPENLLSTFPNLRDC
jgi:hypothetical protein